LRREGEGSGRITYESFGNSSGRGQKDIGTLRPGGEHDPSADPVDHRLLRSLQVFQNRTLMLLFEWDFVVEWFPPLILS